MNPLCKLYLALIANDVGRFDVSEEISSSRARSFRPAGSGRPS
jgi:hypothetical protein